MSFLLESSVGFENDRVAFRVAVEEAGFFDRVAGRVLREAGDVDDAEAGGVV